MTIDALTFLGVAAGAVTSAGFLPQLLKGYRTKKLHDVSYGMPLFLMLGMTLWLSYGILRDDVAVVAANSFGVGSNAVLILLKYRYERRLLPGNG
jgi:MtN3 and saliva related transmembrane protein